MDAVQVLKKLINIIPIQRVVALGNIQGKCGNGTIDGKDIWLLMYIHLLGLSCHCP